MPLKAIVSSNATLAGLALKDTTSVTFDVPGPLLDFLEGLQLLNDVPFSAIVADPEQLPPESLRFFYVDPAWQRALLEGALSATSAGTADDDERLEGFRDTVLAKLDAERAGGPTERVSGMILRSAIVRYVPGLQVRAYTSTGATTQLSTLRQERLSQNILIVLWQGKPQRVELEEPRTAAWFGVDGKPAGDPEYRLEAKDALGIGIIDEDGPPPNVANSGVSGGNFTIHMRANTGGRGVLDIAKLAADIQKYKSSSLWAGNHNPVDSTDLALHLQQQPYRQIFQGTQDVVSSGEPLFLADLDLNVLVGVLKLNLKLPT